MSEVKKLLEEGVNIESPDKYGYTPMHKAVWRRHVNIVKYLIEQGANINAQAPESKDTPLLMINTGVILEGPDPIELVKLLVAAGADVNAADKGGDTALHHAASSRYRSTVAFLIARGADVNQRETDISATPLIKAASETTMRPCDPAILEELVKHGADVNTSMDNGWTPLHFTAFAGNVPCTKMLVQLGADASAKNMGKVLVDSPVDIAKKKSHSEIIEILLKRK